MKRRVKNIIYKFRHFWAALIFVSFVYWWHSVPQKLFHEDYSTAVLDNEGQLLFAQISNDGQWRFPPGDSIPEKYKKCLLAFEDRNFYNHWGISLKGLGRAFVQNFKNGRVVSGGSTITMQLMRMSRKNDSRSISNKIHEMIMASRIEWKLSKDEILATYAAHVPMGGNVVGIEAAAWRYFGKKPYDLSWAECATLAVLPNAPTLMHPGKNRNALKEKRNRLLTYLNKSKEIDDITLQLSLVEPLPEKPLPLPQKAIHLLPEALQLKENEKQLESTISSKLQEKVSNILWMHYDRLAANEIHNAAVLVMNVNTGDVEAYCGNIPDISSDYDSEVDNIQSPRSSGSILKPFLFAFALDQGIITNSSVLEDIPSYYSGYQPKNYNESFDGLVPANEALQRSLNVPFVRLLQNAGVASFLHVLKSMDFSTIDKSSNHYGLSLILGGAEVSLWDLVSIYRGMAYKLKFSKEVSNTQVFKGEVKSSHEVSFSKGAIWQTFESMVEVPRPGEELLWEQFSSAQKIAWKTGTSFGFRDAWSVGISGDYVVGVWVGNSDGEGRPGIVGREAAAPILFDVFRELPSSKWFERPEKLVPIDVCAVSGYLATNACQETSYAYTPHREERLKICPYHQKVLVTNDNSFQVFRNCFKGEVKAQNFFIVPPAIEKYYKFMSPSYQPLPPIHTDCKDMAEQKTMQWVYPQENSKIFIPTNFEEKKEKAVFEISHVHPETEVHWHLNEAYMGSTKDIHQMEFSPTPGEYRITVVDDKGMMATRNFSVVLQNSSANENVY